MNKFSWIVCWFGLIFVKMLCIFLYVLMEMGTLVIIFGVDRIDIVFHSIINESFIWRVEHRRWLNVAGDAFGAFFHILYVVVWMVVALVLGSEQLRWWLESLHFENMKWMKFIDKVLFFFEYYKATEINSAFSCFIELFYSNRIDK